VVVDSVVAAKAVPAPKPILVTAIALPASDAYTSEAIHEVVHTSAKLLERCQRDALADGGPAVTDVNLFVAIQPSGRVLHAVDLDQIDVQADKRRGWLSLCSVAVASSWTFGRHAKDDLAGVLVTVRFRAEAPDERPAGEAKTTALTARWVKEKPERNEYPPYALTLLSRGRLHTIDYSDGTGVCTEYDKRLSCAWFQLDSRGRFALERQDDGALHGRWGYNDDDTTSGTIELVPPGTKPPTSKKKK
jgi:hypothetical protein